MARTATIAIPFSLPHVHKSALPKTAVDDSPGSSLLGLTTTLGAPLLGNQASGNTKTDVCGFLVTIPQNFVEGSAFIVVRARCKVATTKSTVSNKVDMTAKLIGDATVGSDLVATDATALNSGGETSYANYDFKVTATGLRAGDHLWCTLTLESVDTGGTVNTAMSCSRLWALIPVKSSS